MKNFKRIVSFVMAMVIFASFFCYNVGAYNGVFVVYDRSDRIQQVYFSNTSAYATVRIAKWTDVETITDFMATTYAYIDDYEDVENLYDVIASVSLDVWLEDGSHITISDSNYPDPEEGTVDAGVYGRDFLNDYDNYRIVDFVSTHHVGLVCAVYDSYGNIIDFYAESDGPMIQIGTRRLT
jgi:hypothetical protein